MGLLKITLESITLSFCECDLIEGVVVFGLKIVECNLLISDFRLSSSKVVISIAEFSVCCIKLSLERITLSFCECDLIEGVVIFGLKIVESCLLAGDFFLSSSKVDVRLI